MRLRTRLALSPLAMALAGALAIAHAEGPPAVKRTILQKHDLSAEGREGIMASVDFPPGASEGRHTHPTEVFGYVEAGTLTLHVEGRPDAALEAGGSFFIEAGKIHEGVNHGTTPARVVAVFFAPKGQPLTTPAR